MKKRGKRKRKTNRWDATRNGDLRTKVPPLLLRPSIHPRNKSSFHLVFILLFPLRNDFILEHTRQELNEWNEKKERMRKPLSFSFYHIFLLVLQIQIWVVSLSSSSSFMLPPPSPPPHLLSPPSIAISIVPGNHIPPPPLSLFSL